MEALSEMGVLSSTPTAEISAAAGMDSQTYRILSMADGATTVQDIIDISGLPVDVVAPIIQQLYDAGALR